MRRGMSRAVRARRPTGWHLAGSPPRPWVGRRGPLDGRRGPGRPARAGASGRRRAPGRLAAGGPPVAGRAAAVRARPLGLPHPRAGGRPPGPDPAARDRAGRRGGPGRARAGWSPCPGGPAWWSTSAPGPGPSPCRWPPSWPAYGRARGVGRRRRPRGPGAGRGATSSRVAADDPAVGRAGHLAEGSWWEALPEPTCRGRVDLVVSNPPYVAATSGRTSTRRGAGPRAPRAPWWPAAGQRRHAGPGRRGGRPAGRAGLAAPAAGPPSSSWPRTRRRPPVRLARRAGLRRRPGGAGPGRAAAGARGPLVSASDRRRPGRRTRRPDGSSRRLRGGQVVASRPTPSTAWPPGSTGPRRLARDLRRQGPPGRPGPAGAHRPDWRQVARRGVGRGRPWPRRWPTRFWPGPLTVVVPARARRCRSSAGTGSTVGLRAPEDRWLRCLCRKARARWRSPAPTPTAAHRRPRRRRSPPPSTRESVALVVDGGTCDGVPSTVVDCTGRPAPSACGRAACLEPGSRRPSRCGVASAPVGPPGVERRRPRPPPDRSGRRGQRTIVTVGVRGRVRPRTGRPATHSVRHQLGAGSPSGRSASVEPPAPRVPAGRASVARSRGRRRRHVAQARLRRECGRPRCPFGCPSVVGDGVGLDGTGPEVGSTRTRGSTSTSAWTSAQRSRPAPRARVAGCRRGRRRAWWRTSRARWPVPRRPGSLAQRGRPWWRCCG